MAQASYSTLVVPPARPGPEDRSVEIGQLARGAMGTFKLLRIPVPVVGFDSLKAEPKGLLAQLAGQDPGWKEIMDHGLPLAVVMSCI